MFLGSRRLEKLEPYWKQRFNWSNSKQNAWNDCKALFYFDTIEKWAHRPRSQQAEEVWWLSKLTPANALLGKIIHDTLEQQVSQHQLGRAVNEDNAREFFELQVSEHEKAPEQTISDAVNGYTVDADFFNRVRTDGAAQLRNFFRIFWPVYSKLEYMRHEKFDTFSVDGVNVIVKVDLVTRSQDGQIIITDWKTGNEDSDIDHDQQLAVYLLWAHKYYKVPPTKIKTELAYLRTGRVKVISRTEQDLKEIELFVRANAAEMLGVSGREDTPASAEKFRCTSCKYLTICPDGAEFMRDHKNPFRK